MSEPSDFYRVTSVDAARLFGVLEPALVLEVSIEGSDQTLLLWMPDAEAYEYIRRMTDVLFDVDPPLSGVFPTREGEA